MNIIQIVGTVIIILSVAHSDTIAFAASLSDSKDEIPLISDAKEMKEQIAKRFSKGSYVSIAKDKMSNAGFECKYVEDRSGKFLWCSIERNAAPLVSRKWQVIFYHDGNGKIQDIEVTVGLVGP